MKTKIFLTACLFLIKYFLPVMSFGQVVDDSVTFNFTAGGVTSVKAVCKGISWFAGSDTLTLNYLGNSRWKKTLTDVPEGFYYYRILLNHAPVFDQTSFAYFGSGTWINAFEVKDTGNTFSEEKTGPFGSMRENIFKSEKPDKYRKCMVYAPSYYNENQETEYPVVYLLPDSGENSSAWFYQGKINNIIDNAIATEIIEPMLVVLVDWDLYNSDGSIDMESGNNDTTVINELIPFINSHYQTIDSAKYRAIAGSSSGGKIAMETALQHREQFSNLGIFSLPAGFEANQELVDSIKQANFTIFWLGAGMADGSYSNELDFHEQLTNSSVAHNWDTYEGSDNWLVWRKNLNNMLTQLFK
jgi:endo-1,4-beta-xylanase